MKYLWEEKDIVCGMIVHKQTDNDFEANGWTAKWTFKIGFLAGEDSKKNIIFIAMTDGMVGGSFTKQEAADWLNENRMAPMRHDWWIQIVHFLRDSYLPS